MSKGPIVTVVLTVAAVIAVVLAFMQNAGQFVTIRQAKTASGDQLHLAGDIVPESINRNTIAHALVFKLKDENGDVVTVRHTGEMPNNFGDVKRVVAIGCMKHGEFDSSQLLVKCPSKYEADRKVASAN